MIGKIIRTDKGWKFVELSRREYDEVMDKLLEHNLKELKRVIKRLTKTRGLEIPFEKAVELLFNKQAMQSYTIITNELTKKIFITKEMTKIKLTEEQKKQIEEIGKEIKHGESAINKVFEKINEEIIE